MSEDKKENTDGETAEAKESPPVFEAEEEELADNTIAEDFTEAKDVGALEAEIAELKDKLLRAMAEAENVRRRAERDKENASKFAIAGFAREMLQVNDNLRRALGNIDKNARKESEALENLAVGLELAEREIMNTFERAGIKPIDPIGRKFDPNLHEAMFEVEDGSQPPGTVIQVVETGYLLFDRPLRPARVGIAKGGPKATTQGESRPGLSAKGPSVYEKQADARSDASGSKLNEEL